MSGPNIPPTAPPFTQPYSSYPQAYGQYSTQQYSSVNYASQPQSTVYSTFQVPYGRKEPSSWIDSLPPQERSSVDPEVASKTMNRFISIELKYEGFETAEPAALNRLEAEVVTCKFRIYSSRLVILKAAKPVQLFKTYIARSTIMRILLTGLLR
jgi:hypothetical protein